jgi:hypothetical protein
MVAAKRSFFGVVFNSLCSIEHPGNRVSTEQRCSFHPYGQDRLDAMSVPFDHEAGFVLLSVGVRPAATQSIP